MPQRSRPYAPRARPRLARYSLGGAPSGPPVQELALAHVRRERCAALELGARPLVPAELPQEVAADGRQQVARLECRLVDEGGLRLVGHDVEIRAVAIDVWHRLLPVPVIDEALRRRDSLEYRG